MPETNAFQLDPPSDEDLSAAEEAWRRGQSRYGLRTDDSWWRVIRAPSEKHAADYAETCYSSTALNRFTPISQSGGIIPAGYAGSTRKVALWEIVLRGIRHGGVRRVQEHETHARYLVELRLLRPLALLDVRRPRDANLVISGKRPPDLTRVWPIAYGHTRAWAQALYTRLPTIDGIIYESHQVPGDCVVLYQPSRPRVFEVAGEPMSIRQEPVRSLLIKEACKANAGVDFGEDTDEEDRPFDS